ncbi:MAG: arginase family protein [Pseudomonadota bacterium]
MTDFLVIPAPAFVGRGLKGTDQLPRALLDAGLAERLGAPVADGPGPMTWSEDLDAVNERPPFDVIGAYLHHLADDVAAAFDQEHLPIVLGGDCTLLLGAAAACQRAKVDGLLFVDGHTDFWPLGKPDWETASCDLGLVTGLSPGKIPYELAKLSNGPPFDASKVAAFGYRDGSDEGDLGDTLRRTTILQLPLTTIRHRGFGNTAAAALDRVASKGQRFWLHLDLDVLDDAIFSAVDYRIPDGLAPGEVVALLRRARETGALAGMTVTILNPTLDHDGRQAALAVDLLAAGLSST